MSTKAGLFARFFGRSKHSVVTKLYTHAIGQPLFVHPTMGESMIGAYMDGAVDAPETVVASAGNIAILNISGGLVNRPMPDICGDGPLSYSAIRCAFDSALADGNVKAIIFRMDSPGGMCAGLVDLTDHIFASRGIKPIVAQLDDMAYSACYGIASACDSIQVTRTSGSGSIGCMTYHIDISGANAQAGIKITYIYAGDKKVDGNPDAPLSDSAQRDAQAKIDGLYQLFVKSIAKYRGVDPQAIIDTQAACYNGEAIVAAGLADSVGTLEDLLVKLSTPATPEDAMTEQANEPTTIPAPAPAPAATLTEQQISQLARAAVVDAVSAAGLAPTVAMTLLDQAANVTPESVAERIAHARTVTDLCAAANLRGTEAGYIKANTPIESVRKELQGAVADNGPELVTSHQEPRRAGTATTQSIYERRRAAAAGNGSNRGKR